MVYVQSAIFALKATQVHRCVPWVRLVEHMQLAQLQIVSIAQKATIALVLQPRRHVQQVLRVQLKVALRQLSPLLVCGPKPDIQRRLNALQELT